MMARGLRARVAFVESAAPPAHDDRAANGVFDGGIHSDIERGFIRAEVNSYDDLVAVDGSFAELRGRGQLRLEGKDYIVRDGEICHFRFNVGK